MPPKCFPNASQMLLRCVTLRCLPDQRCLSDASQVLLHCFLLFDSTPLISFFHDDKRQFWYQWCFLLYDSSVLTSLPWFFKLVQQKDLFGVWCWVHLLPIAYCLLPIACCLLPIACDIVEMAHFMCVCLPWAQSQTSIPKQPLAITIIATQWLPRRLLQLTTRQIFNLPDKAPQY